MFHSVSGAPRTEWNMQLASNRLTTPLLAFSSIANALSATASEASDVVFEARTRVHVQNHGVIETHDYGYSPTGMDNPMALAQLRLFDTFAATYGNPFEDTRIESVEVDLDLRFEQNLAMILDAMVPSPEVDPDSDVNVYLTLQHFGKPPETKIVPVHVPQTAAGEKIEIAFEAGNAVQIERPDPKNLEQIFDNVRMGYPATSLVVSTKMPSQGLKFRGHVVRSLPGSALDALQLTGDSYKSATFPTFVRSELPMQELLVGSARVTLDVRRERLR
jgi:hypothetical protein